MSCRCAEFREMESKDDEKVGEAKLFGDTVEDECRESSSSCEASFSEERGSCDDTEESSSKETEELDLPMRKSSVNKKDYVEDEKIDKCRSKVSGIGCFFFNIFLAYSLNVTYSWYLSELIAIIQLIFLIPTNNLSWDSSVRKMGIIMTAKKFFISYRQKSTIGTVQVELSVLKLYYTENQDLPVELRLPVLEEKKDLECVHDCSRYNGFSW